MVQKLPFWQHPTKQQLHNHLLSLSQTIHVRRKGNAMHFRKMKDNLISDVFHRSPTHGPSSAGQPSKTYIRQLCAVTRCNLEDLLWTDRLRERESWDFLLSARFDDGVFGCLWCWFYEDNPVLREMDDRLCIHIQEICIDNEELFKLQKCIGQGNLKSGE